MTSAAPAGLVADLIARGSYERAIGLLEVQVRGRPQELGLRQQLADVLALAGRGAEAAPMFQALAEELALRGRAAQAIAAAKRAQALDPSQGGEERLAGLIDSGPPAAAPVPVSVPVPVPTAAPVAVPDGPAHEDALRAQLLGMIDEALRETDGDAGARAREVESPLFEDFDREELVEVIRGLRLLTFEPGDVVVSEGEPGQSLFVVTRGRVRAFVRQSSGAQRPVRDLTEGDFFGEVAVLEGGRRTATVTCAAACELLELDRPTLEAIAARHPGVRGVMERFRDQRARGGVEHMIRGLGPQG